MWELTLRLIVSLAIVIGLLLLLARFGARKFKGSNDALVHVVHRQPLSRTSAVAVVTVGSRVLVLGTTEQQVSVLAELDPEELDELGSVDGSESTGLTGLTDVSYLPAPVVEAGTGTHRSAAEPVAALELLGPGSPLSEIEEVTRRAREDAARVRTSKVPGTHRAAPVTRTDGPTQGPLAGSILSAQTWRQAFNAARRAS